MTMENGIGMPTTQKCEIDHIYNIYTHYGYSIRYDYICKTYEVWDDGLEEWTELL